MSIESIMNERASCRNFSDEPVSDELVEKLIDIACKAPSAGGFQNYSIIKIRRPETKQKLAKLCRNQSFIAKAPLCLLFCIDYRRVERINQIIPAPLGMSSPLMEGWMSILDTAICAQTLCMAAQEEGLRSIYIGNVIHTIDQVSELLHLPPLVCPSILVVLGYPKHESKPSAKYDAKLILHEEFYQDPAIDTLMHAYEQKYSHWNMRPSKALVDKIAETCCSAQGAQLAAQFRQDVAEHARISPYQFWFGAYYLAEEGHLQAQGYKNFFKSQGFDWLE